MNCQNCGSEVKEGAKFCRSCGAEVIREAVSVERVCPACGNVLKEGVAFCNNCGQRVAEIAEPLTAHAVQCPQCGNPLSVGASFCGRCGYSLNQSPQPHTAAYAAAPKKKTDKGLIFLIALFVVVIGCAGAIWYVYSQNRPFGPDISKPKTKITETKKEEDDEEKLKTKDDANKLTEVDEAVAENTTDALSAELKTVYLFPSDREYITAADLYGKTQDEVALIRNEIYARHGYIFNTEPFKSYFESRDWYIPNPSFTDSLFSEVEKANKDFIVKYETEKGWR